jgi:hypothetical protein
LTLTLRLTLRLTFVFRFALVPRWAVPADLAAGARAKASPAEPAANVNPIKAAAMRFVSGLIELSFSFDVVSFFSCDVTWLKRIQSPAPLWTPRSGFSIPASQSRESWTGVFDVFTPPAPHEFRPPMIGKRGSRHPFRWAR